MPTKKKKASPEKKAWPPKSIRRKSRKEVIFWLSVSVLPPVDLKPLKPFSATCRRMSGMAFVIIQHLSPKHKSIMASLLAKHTRMAVREIEDATPLEPNCVYLNPPEECGCFQPGPSPDGAG